MKKTAVITGGAQGIGFAAAKAFIREGYAVALLDRDEHALAWACRELGIPASPFPCDLADAAKLEQTAGEIKNHFPSINVLVNNAAHVIFKPLPELTLEEWNRAIATNLTAAFLTAKLFEAKLRASQGSIVNIASTRALMSEPHTESYSASKGGIVALTHALAISLGPDVRVNAVSPGWIDVSGLGDPAVRTQTALTEADHAQHPAGRVGCAEDIAELILYLCSEKAGFITGQNIIADGGMTKRMIYI